MKKSKTKSKREKSSIGVISFFTLQGRRRHGNPKPEMETKSKPINVDMMVIEQSKLTGHNLNITEDKEFKIIHNGKSLTFNRDDVLQKTFTEMNWHGGVKRRFAFCRLPENGTPELIGLDEFDPYHTISAEEADIMLHEGVTMRGVKHLVTKITRGGGLGRIWIFVIILVVIIAVIYMNYQGGI